MTSRPWGRVVTISRLKRGHLHGPVEFVSLPSVSAKRKSTRNQCYETLECIPLRNMATTYNVHTIL